MMVAGVARPSRWALPSRCRAAYPPGMFQAGAFGTILNERHEVLLCHRRDLDLWNAPGGLVEASESPWDAVP